MARVLRCLEEADERPMGDALQASSCRACQEPAGSGKPLQVGQRGVQGLRCSLPVCKRLWRHVGLGRKGQGSRILLVMTAEPKPFRNPLPGTSLLGSGAGPVAGERHDSHDTGLAH